MEIRCAKLNLMETKGYRASGASGASVAASVVATGTAGVVAWPIVQVLRYSRETPRGPNDCREESG